MADERAGHKKQGEVEGNQQPMAAGSETMKRWSQLVAQAWTDERFKQQLITKPAAVLREHGIEVPAGVEVRVVEPTEKLLYFLLPPKPADGAELTSSQLTGVAGGVKCDIMTDPTWPEGCITVSSGRWPQGQKQ
jgi:hypothetical protein